MKKTILGLMLISSFSYSYGEVIRILYPNESPTEIKIAENLQKKAKEQGIQIEYVYSTNADLEKKFILFEKANKNVDLVVLQDITNVSTFLEPIDEFKSKYNFNEGGISFFSKEKLLALPVGLVVYGFMGNNIQPQKIEDLYKLKTSIPNGTERHSFRNFYIYALSFDVSPIDLDSPKFKEVLKLYKKVEIQKTHKNDKYPDMFKHFADNKVDFIHSGSYHIANQEPWGLNNLSNVNPFIIGDKTYIGVTGMAMSKKSKNKENAKKVMELYLDKEVIESKFLEMDIPAYDIDIDYSTLGNDKSRIKQKWIEISKKGTPLFSYENQHKIEKAFRDNIILYIEGKVNEDEFISNIKKHINN